MQNNSKLILHYILIYITSLIIIWLMVFIFSFFIKLNYIPKEYDYLTFWITIFNTLFWSWIIFSIYQWFIQRKNQIKDDFINRFDELLDKFSPDLDNNILINKDYNPYILENFKTININKVWEKLILDFQFKEVTKFDYYKDNGDIYEYLYNNFQIANYLYLKKEIYNNDKDIENYIKWRLSQYINIKFYCYLFLLQRIRSKNIHTNNSSSMEWKWKYLEINNPRIFSYIIEIRNKIENLNKLLN